MRQANAPRKIIVIGTISDFPGDTSSRYRQVARNAMAVADSVIFVGPQASQCLGAKQSSGENSLRAYATTDQLLRFFRGYLQAGDLVLLKGSEKVENLGQVTSKWIERLAADGVQNSAVSSLESKPRRDDHQKQVPIDAHFQSPVHAIVGLGNPGRQYENTPHNVGQQTLDVLASRMGAKWSTHQDAIIARATVKSQDVLLIKPQTFVNNTGPLLLQLAEQFGFSHEQCTLIHDDIDLDIGTVRVRRAGSDGGHRGVQSILVAFQSQQFPRVKIGVGRPVSRKEIARYVVTPFKPDQKMVIAEACGNAADRALENIKSAPQAISGLAK
jgi:aminoacyl-tRNA hydrolase